MISIKKKFEFHAAHHLPSHQGKCKNLHGHGYVLEIEVAGGIQAGGSSEGMVVDFGDLKGIVSKRIIEKLDHSDLNNRWRVPTAENMVASIAAELLDEFSSLAAAGKHLALVSVTLWETSTSCAIWRPL